MAANDGRPRRPSTRHQKTKVIWLAIGGFVVFLLIVGAITSHGKQPVSAQGVATPDTRAAASAQATASIDQATVSPSPASTKPASRAAATATSSEQPQAVPRRSAASQAPTPKTSTTRKSTPKASPTHSASPAAAAPASCYPLTNGGNCYEPGEYCRDDDHGASGIAGDGKNIVCEDNDGWRWEPV